MFIVIVEDEVSQLENIVGHLRNEFGASVEGVASAHRFQQLIPRLREQPPSLFIIDVMLAWHAWEDIAVPVPPQIDLDDIYRGVECQKWLADEPKLKNVPVILLTDLDQTGGLQSRIEQRPRNVLYLRKEPDWLKLDRMVRSLRLS